MRKLMVVLILALAALAGPQAPVHAGYPDPAGLTPFTAETNYMSLDGWVRWQYWLRTGRWLSLREIQDGNAVRDQGKPIGPA